VSRGSIVTAVILTTRGAGGGGSFEHAATKAMLHTNKAAVEEKWEQPELPADMLVTP
jgi:hypothetical protein